MTTAGLKNLTPHCMRHGFASVLLDKGKSPVMVAKRGGWKSAQHVLKTYGHDIAPANATDDLFDTELAQTEEKRKAIN